MNALSSNFGAKWEWYLPSEKKKSEGGTVGSPIEAVFSLT
jgi:hypothetical protein